jgi:hypothetical protein
MEAERPQKEEDGEQVSWTLGGEADNWERREV